MIKNFEQLKEMLKAMPVKRKVAVVPAQDEHTLEAISHAYRDGMVEPVLIGDEPKIREILAQIGTDADKMTIIHVEDPTEAIQKAADMARDGEVDCIMKGKTETDEKVFGRIQSVCIKGQHDRSGRRYDHWQCIYINR